ncbi:MAG TPA: mobile mystery protein B [Candidatus Acidoferrales bacterium]|nr:mobile mystery protein B [Candidatus Acidoferrales bacterium]
MHDHLFDGEDDANTPLTAEEREQIIPSYIALRHELNEAEQVNIGTALRWAGKYRTTARNIGVDAYRIAEDVQHAINDAQYWVEHATYEPDEIAVRFSHRLVAIHPFPNGNGRFSRLVGDLLALRLGQPPFTWGRANLVNAGETRRRYIDALRAADWHDFGPLLLFARS